MGVNEVCKGISYYAIYETVKRLSTATIASNVVAELFASEQKSQFDLLRYKQESQANSLAIDLRNLVNDDDDANKSAIRLK